MILSVITPAAGKRLIAKAIAQHDDVVYALKQGTVVIVAGTTNGYVAEEVLKTIGQENGFRRQRFFRGITMPPSVNTTSTGRIPDESQFPGDVVIEHGEWSAGKTLFDVVDAMKEGDVILKGANAVNLDNRQAAILIGHPTGGTITAAIQAVVGRRVRLILPVGLEKRVTGNLQELAILLNAPGSRGPRMMPVSGQVVTEIDAIELLADVKAELAAAGGVCGAEGAVWLAIRGTEEASRKAEEIVSSVMDEPPFML